MRKNLFKKSIVILFAAMLLSSCAPANNSSAQNSSSSEASVSNSSEQSESSQNESSSESSQTKQEYVRTARQIEYDHEKSEKLQKMLVEAAHNYVEKLDISELDYVAKEDDYYLIDGMDFAFINAAMAEPQLKFHYDYIAEPADDGKVKITSVILRYHDKERMEALNKEIDKAIEEAILPGMTELDKIMSVHDYLIREGIYDNDYYNDRENISLDSFEPHGILIDKVGVCDSYTKAMSLILNKIGIETKYVGAFCDEDVSHAWNLVKLNDHWYHVDATWDDYGEWSDLWNYEAFDDEFLDLGYSTYYFFMKSDAAFEKLNHYNWDKNLPKADDTTYDDPNLFKTAGSTRHYYNGKWYCTQFDDDGNPRVVVTDTLGKEYEFLDIDKIAYSMTGYKDKLYYADFEKVYCYDIDTKEEKVFFEPDDGINLNYIRFAKGKIIINTQAEGAKDPDYIIVEIDPITD